MSGRSDGDDDLSQFFAVADIEYAASVRTASDGDLWPSTWADDDRLYTACGDGLGFLDPGDSEPGPAWSDIVVNSVAGIPETGLSGHRLAHGDAVSPVWTSPEHYNRKPTGIVAVDGNSDGCDELYLAVQDLRCGAETGAFDDAPAAGIVWSQDYGRTWNWTGEPHFADHVFTTVMFLDLGRSNGRAGSAPGTEPGYVYAYGLDNNWRTSYSGTVGSPEHLYLARVPAAEIGTRDAWEFYAGQTADGLPSWSGEIARREPVLSDRRRLFGWRTITEPGATPLAQGGVVYNQGINRYLYTSWTEYSFEFYEAATPWGPWRLFLSHDFGPFPWIGPLGPAGRHGGYAVTAPSKFISRDGRDLWVQSNWFWQAATYFGNTYHFSLRRLRLEPTTCELGQDPDWDGNLAMRGAWPIAAAATAGQISVLNDGRIDRAEDSRSGAPERVDHWGYTWSHPVKISRVVYTSGPWDYNGGWFATQPIVEVRFRGRWQPAVLQHVFPAYPCDSVATGNRTFTIAFPEVITDGVRLVGRPGGRAPYSAIAELEVYRNTQLS